MWARWWAFAVWAAVAGSAAFWGLRLFVQSPPAPPQATLATAAPRPAGDLTRLLGVDPPPPPPVAAVAPPPDARFQLLGVVSPVVGRQGGVALIAIDGSPAKAYPVGATVWGELQLQSVHQRGAALGPRGQPASVTLELAALPPAATGSLPPALVAAAAPVGFAPAAGVAADTAPGMPALGGGPVPAPMPMAVRAPGGAPQAMPPGVPAAPGALMDAQGRFVAGARPNGGRNPVLRPPGTPAAQPPQNPVPEPTMENVR